MDVLYEVKTALSHVGFLFVCSSTVTCLDFFFYFPLFLSFSLWYLLKFLFGHWLNPEKLFSVYWNYIFRFSTSTPLHALEYVDLASSTLTVATHCNSCTPAYLQLYSSTHTITQCEAEIWEKFNHTREMKTDSEEYLNQKLHSPNRQDWFLRFVPFGVFCIKVWHLYLCLWDFLGYQYSAMMLTAVFAYDVSSNIKHHMNVFLLQLIYHEFNSSLTRTFLHEKQK